MSLELEREETVQRLCRQFARDNLTTQELETRLEAAYKARTLDELRSLTASLPAVADTDADDTHVYQAADASVAEARERRVLAVFGSVKKRGEWEPGPHARAISVFSELELDFREARLSPGITTLDVKSVFASVKIIVPPGLRVECDGSAVMGTFEDKTQFTATDPDAPTIRITGLSVFSEVVVKMRMPDESAMGALKREWLK